MNSKHAIIVDELMNVSRYLLISSLFLFKHVHEWIWKRASSIRQASGSCGSSAITGGLQAIPSDVEAATNQLAA